MVCKLLICLDSINSTGHLLFFSISFFPPTFLCHSDAIITVFFRLDEVLGDIIEDQPEMTEKSQDEGDSKMKSIDELFTWLDAVISRTSEGPVMLVGTFADEVKDPEQRDLVSQHIYQRLQEQEHPILQRLVKPNLVFFAVNNTRGLEDPGVCAYRETLLKLAQNSKFAKQLVPFSFLRLQDALLRLTRPADTKQPDSAVMKSLREFYRQPVLHRLTLADFGRLYEEMFGTNIGGDVSNEDLRTYLQFLHLLGVVTHKSAAAVDDLVVIDPMWLLSQITAVIRLPQLHPSPGDDLLPLVPKQNLYEHGILECVVLEKLWDCHEDYLQTQLFAFCLKVRLQKDSSPLLRI